MIGKKRRAQIEMKYDVCVFSSLIDFERRIMLGLFSDEEHSKLTPRKIRTYLKSLNHSLDCKRLKMFPLKAQARLKAKINKEIAEWSVKLEEFKK